MIPLKLGVPKSMRKPNWMSYVLLGMGDNSYINHRRVLPNRDIPAIYSHKVSKLEKFQPYKIVLVKDFHEEDPEWWIQFCQTLIHTGNAHLLLVQIFFSMIKLLLHWLEQYIGRIVDVWLRRIWNEWENITYRNFGENVNW